MAETSGDGSLVNKWRAGDQKAAREIVNRYIERLLDLARRRLSQRLARRVDPEDIVQSAFRTFFGRAAAGQFHVADPDDLCKLLMRITLHKTLRQAAFHRAAKRDLNQEVVGGSDDTDRLREVLDREPTPEAANMFMDELEQMLNQLRPEDSQIIDLRLQGFSNVEIAEKLKISDRKIRRLLERLRGLADQSETLP